MLWLAVLAGGCGPDCEDGYGLDDAGDCVLLADPPGDGGGDAEITDPIITLGAVHNEHEHDQFYEFTDAAVIDDQYAAGVGQGGLAIVSRDDGSFVDFYDIPRAYRVDRDPSTGLIWCATRSDQIIGVNVDDPTDPSWEEGFSPGPEWYEDISADDGRILLGMQERGAVLWDQYGQELGTLPADYAFGVALLGDRALVTDGLDLVLWDVTDPPNAIELDRVTLSGEGRDVAFDGQRIAVALGGDGAAVLDVEGDTLIERGDLETHGASFGVALDGDDLWIAAWSHVALASVGEGTPVVLGHEPAQQIALGIDAADGRATVGDWFYATALERVVGAGGPELVMSEWLWFPQQSLDAQILAVTNAGSQPLNISFQKSDGYTISADALSLAPGESGSISVTPNGAAVWGELTWTSDDPDEPFGAVALQVADTTIGYPHPDFSLWGFTMPDADLELYTLSDYSGQVIFLDYFSTW